MPTVSFGRQGGESTRSLGIKERNFLGLGVDVEIETYQNSQRKGYKIQSTIPMFRNKNIDFKLQFSDNDDGTQQSLFLQKHLCNTILPIALKIYATLRFRDVQLIRLSVPSD